MNPTFPISTSPSEGATLEGGFVVVERVVDRVEAAGISFSRNAFAASRRDGIVITGSAADVGIETSTRALGELLERAATVAALDAPALVLRTLDGTPTGTMSPRDVFLDVARPGARASRSNGVALAADWSSACRAAAYELIERDAVLRSWFGETLPVAIADPSPLANDAYEWRAVSLPISAALAEPFDAATVFVCAFPRVPGLPFLRGSACRASSSAALGAARREALQGLAFLWGETIPERSPSPEPTPMFHLDHYLCPENHGAIRAWLDGRHGRTSAPAADVDGRFSWVDLTPSTADYRVAAARSAGALPLIFGEWPLEQTGDVRRFGPHPIA